MRIGLPACWLALCASLLPVSAPAHEGDAEDRAMRLHQLLLALDRDWAAAAREQDPARRAALLATHAQALGAVQRSLREAADRSPCVMLEARDAARQLACLTDTEARLRATERLLGHVINRLGVESVAHGH